jgi:hypothetical protein
MTTKANISEILLRIESSELHPAAIRTIPKTGRRDIAAVPRAHKLHPSATGNPADADVKEDIMVRTLALAAIAAAALATAPGAHRQCAHRQRYRRDRLSRR